MRLSPTKVLPVLDPLGMVNMCRNSMLLRVLRSGLPGLLSSGINVPCLGFCVYESQVVSSPYLLVVT
jgi:hypothetical protein